LRKKYEKSFLEAKNAPLTESQKAMLPVKSISFEIIFAYSTSKKNQQHSRLWRNSKIPTSNVFNKLNIPYSHFSLLPNRPALLEDAVVPVVNYNGESLRQITLPKVIIISTFKSNIEIEIPRSF
jgi:hypothetical protein